MKTNDCERLVRKPEKHVRHLVLNARDLPRHLAFNLAFVTGSRVGNATWLILLRHFLAFTSIRRARQRTSDQLAAFLKGRGGAASGTAVVGIEIAHISEEGIIMRGPGARPYRLPLPICAPRLGQTGHELQARKLYRKLRVQCNYVPKQSKVPCNNRNIATWETPSRGMLIVRMFLTFFLLGVFIYEV